MVERREYWKQNGWRRNNLTLFQLGKDNFYHCDSISRDKAYLVPLRLKEESLNIGNIFDLKVFCNLFKPSE